MLSSLLTRSTTQLPASTQPVRYLTVVVLSLLLGACGQSGGDKNEQTSSATDSYEETLRLALERAEPGDVIEIPEGTFAMTRSLVLSTDGVTIRGQGMDKSVLSFKGQLAGAEGLLVNASDFTIEDVAIEDTTGDALKINEGKNIVVRRVRTEWTNGPSVDNGAYGIYPVQTENTRIEGSVAIGASDAGIYVGQSHNIIVCNNRAAYNVAGIEVENSTSADVYNNIAEHNTGGILVFNMPDIPKEGHSTRVFNNDVRNNNTANFAAAGTAVAVVPAGTGVIINANDKVEVFENRFEDNATANVLISSYFSAELAGEREHAAEFDPYPEQVYIYNNRYVGGGDQPDREELAALLTGPLAEAGRLPDIVWDGYVRDAAEAATAQICVDETSAVLLNVDAGNEYANATMDMAAHRCSLPKLTEVVL